MSVSHFFNSLLAILNEMSPYILLGFIIAGFLHVFIKPEAMSRHLAGRGWGPVVRAALYGIPLPLCSCGVLPTAVSLRRRGASKGATTSFLIATPQTGVDSIAATYSLLGLPFAILRPVAALVGAAVGGRAVDVATRDEIDCDSCCADSADDTAHRSFPAKVIEALRYGLVDMVGNVGKWLVIGLIVAAIITVFVPDELLLSLNRYPVVAMLVMVAIAVPMYICATGSIPIALSLMLKGLSPGTAFVLLMAGPAANFASVIILSRTQGKRATAIYLASVIVTALCFGLLIDFLLPRDRFIPSASGITAHCHDAGFPLFATLCSALLVGLLIYTSVKTYLNNKKQTSTTMTKEYHIKGMACGHCKATVEKHIAAVPSVTSVTVDLAKGIAYVEGTASDADIIKAVELAGFEMA